MKSEEGEEIPAYAGMTTSNIQGHWVRIEGLRYVAAGRWMDYDGVNGESNWVHGYAEDVWNVPLTPLRVRGLNRGVWAFVYFFQSQL